MDTTGAVVSIARLKEPWCFVPENFGNATCKNVGCSANAEGVLCGSCASGSLYNQVSGECESCDTQGLSRNPIVIGVAILFAFLAIAAMSGVSGKAIVTFNKAVFFRLVAPLYDIGTVKILW